MPQSPHRLDAIMDARRVDLGLEWQEVATAAGIRTQTLRVARKGEAVNGLTKRGIEKALRWAPGSFDAVVGGGAPTTLEEQSRQAASPADAARVDAIEALLRTLPPEAQDEVVRRIQRQEREGQFSAEHDAPSRSDAG